MKIIIERIRYTQLRNDEYLQLVRFIINIGEKYDNEKLYLDKAYGELSAFLPLLNAIKVFKRKNDRISEMKNLNIERNTLLKSINKTVAGLDHADLPEIKEYSKKLMTFLEKHQSKTIPLANRTIESARLMKMKTDYNESTDIQIAFQVLGLQAIIDRLFAVNREYSALFCEYIVEKSMEKRIDMVDFRKNCTKALGQYFDAIQYCAFTHEENDYQPLVNKLKLLNAYCNQQLKARATRRKRGKKVLKEPSIKLSKVEKNELF
jgi:hypothetical protein